MTCCQNCNTCHTSQSASAPKQSSRSQGQRSIKGHSEHSNFKSCANTRISRPVTLLRVPKPRPSIARCFHLGSGGWKAICCALRQPRGRVTITASPLNVSPAKGELAESAVGGVCLPALFQISNSSMLEGVTPLRAALPSIFATFSQSYVSLKGFHSYAISLKTGVTYLQWQGILPLSYPKPCPVLQQQGNILHQVVGKPFNIVLM